MSFRTYRLRHVYGNESIRERLADISTISKSNTEVAEATQKPKRQPSPIALKTTYGQKEKKKMQNVQQQGFPRGHPP
jgi:hypothetical protein